MEKRLIEKLVNAMEIREDQSVLLNFWGEENDIADLYDFASEITAKGAMPMLLLHTSQYECALFDKMKAGNRDRWMKQFEVCEVVIDIIEKPIGIPPAGLDKEQYPLYGAYMRELFQAFSTKEKMIQITMPSDANAEYAGLQPEDYMKRMIKALDIDYPALKKDCQTKLDGFKGNIRTVRSGKDCVLTMDTTGRDWIIDAGDGALPCGEVYIAPVEENSNGTVYFKELGVEGVGVYPDVTVTVTGGRLVTSTCEEFNHFLNELSENGNVVAELGIGMNPGVNRIEGDPTLDENVIGTFHIAIGMNHLFGGKNVCQEHYDFVTEGTVE